MHDTDGADKNELVLRSVSRVGHNVSLSRRRSRVRVPYIPQNTIRLYMQLARQPLASEDCEMIVFTLLVR